MITVSCLVADSKEICGRSPGARRAERIYRCYRKDSSLNFDISDHEAINDLIKTIEANYASVAGRQVSIYICRASEGVSEIKIEK